MGKLVVRRSQRLLVKKKLLKQSRLERHPTKKAQTCSSSYDRRRNLKRFSNSFRNNKNSKNFWRNISYTIVQIVVVKISGKTNSANTFAVKKISLKYCNSFDTCSNQQGYKFAARAAAPSQTFLPGPLTALLVVPEKQKIYKLRLSPNKNFAKAKQTLMYLLKT